MLGCDRASAARGMCLMHYKRSRSASSQPPVVFQGAFEQDVRVGSLPAHRPDLGPCWEWTGARNAAGYGIISRFMFGTKLAHRVSKMLSLGRELNGDLMHHCDNPPCVRPAHLQEATHAENMADRAAKGRAFAPRAGQSHCKNGHELTPETTTVYLKDGYESRRCIQCRKDYNKKQAEQRKQERHDRGLLRNRKVLK